MDTLSYSPLRHLWKFWPEDKVSTRVGQGCLMCVQLAASSARAASWGSLQAGLCPSGALCQLQYVLPYHVYKVSSWTEIISLFLTAIFNLSLNHQKSLKCCECFTGFMLQKTPITQNQHFWFMPSFPKKEKIFSKQGWEYFEFVSLRSPLSGFPLLC